jgi:hypothetical protein
LPCNVLVLMGFLHSVVVWAVVPGAASGKRGRMHA